MGCSSENDIKSSISLSQLPEDILEIITDKLRFEDYIRFCEISKSMRSFTRGEERFHKSWVMLSNKPGDKTRPFYSPSEGKVYSVKLPKVVRRSWCCGSHQGWLILAHKTRGTFVYNPISGQRFRLPTHHVENKCHTHFDRSIYLNQIKTKYEKGEPRTHRQHIKRCPYFLSKVVLSSVPASSSSTTSSLLAAAITENHKILVTVCHPDRSDKKWRQFCPVALKEEEGLLAPIVPPRYGTGTIKEEDKDLDQEEEIELLIENENTAYNSDEMYERDITDIVFYKGHLYVVNTYGKLKVVKITNDYDFSLTRIDMHPLKLKRKEMHELNTYYLVESCHGELLLVVRIREEHYDKERYTKRFETVKFVVFRLDEGEPCKWVRMESIGDQVLFLGQNYSTSVSSSHIKIRGNCIYFTDCFPTHYYIDYYMLYPRLYKDLGVYYLDDESVENLVPAELDSHLNVLMRQPILFTPRPW